MAAGDWLSELYLTHRRLLLLVAWNITGNRDVAEDVVQAAIVRLAMREAPPNNAKFFALQVVRNMAIDHVRADRRRQESHEEVVRRFSSNSHDDIDDEPLRESVTLALETLDRDSQETVRLHLQGELTFREIGELLGLPVQTVASRYRRAIEKLRTIVESQHEPR